jgi:hypothetical protein
LAGVSPRSPTCAQGEPAAAELSTLPSQAFELGFAATMSKAGENKTNHSQQDDVRSANITAAKGALLASPCPP